MCIACTVCEIFDQAAGESPGRTLRAEGFPLTGLAPLAAVVALESGEEELSPLRSPESVWLMSINCSRLFTCTS